MEEERFQTTTDIKDHPQSTERELDADALEEILPQITRSTARAHVEFLIQKLRRESTTLKRVEESNRKVANEGVSTLSLKPESAITVPPSKDVVPKPASEMVSSQERPSQLSHVTVTSLTEPQFVPIDRFSFDVGGYNSQYVSLYVTLPGIGSIPKSNVTCNFTKTTIDLRVVNLNNKSYRMYRDNLDKEINPPNCKYIIKADKIVVKLAKCKGEYGSYDYWSDLTSKKKKKSSGKKEDPNAIMDLMKEMYDSGDDNMKKMIGETMLKQQRGELGKDGMPDMAGTDFGKM